MVILLEDSNDVYEWDLDIYCSFVDLDDVIVVDVYVMIEDGKVVSCVEGMLFWKINKVGFKVSLVRVVGKFVFVMFKWVVVLVLVKRVFG